MSDPAGVAAAVRPPAPGAWPARLRPSPRVAARAAVALLVPVLWALSLPGIRLSRTSGYGLLPALPPQWWLAVAVAVVPYLLAALDRRCPAWILAVHQAGLVLLLFGTTSATYPEPRFPWTYKHLGVVEHVLATGGLDRSLDIYNNWPGLFLLAAGVHEVTGLSPITLARWSEPVFGLLFSAAVWYAVRALTRDRRVAAVTLLVFTLGNWIGQNYFAPQALAFVLALAFLGVVLRALPLRDGAGRVVLRRPLARLLRVPEPAPSGTAAASPGADGTPAPASGTAADGTRLAGVRGPVVAAALFAALVVTHQLTPLAVLLQLGALVAVVRVRHRWLIAVCAALEAGWLALSLGYVARHWDLFAPGIDTPSQGLPALTPALPGMALGHRAPTVLVGVVGLVAAVAGLRGLVRRAAPVVPAVLAAVPVLLLAVQSYGGEGILRVYLYALPWLALVVGERAVAACTGGSTGGTGGRVRAGFAAAGVAVLAALALPSMLGSELAVQVDPGDVAASRWFEQRTPPGAYPVTVTDAGFPLLLTAGYPAHLRGAVTLRPADGSGLGPPAAVLDRARTVMRSQGPGGYLVLTASQYTFARMYGLATAPELDRIADAVAAAPDFRVVRRQGRDLIAEHLSP